MHVRFPAAALAIVAAALVTLPASAADAPAAGAPVAKPTASMSPQGQYLVDNLKKPGWKQTTSGLQYRVVKSVPAAAGPRPMPGTFVTVHYDGTFIDGKKFDSSMDRMEPATFELANVIPGWQEGVPLMREGEIYEFALPAGLAYGSETRGPIPGGSTLLFRVRLLWVAMPAAEPAAAAAAAAAAKPAAKPAAK